MRTCLSVLLLLVLLAAPAAAQDVFQEGTTITITLMNGDILTGLLEDADGPRLVILHDILGRIEIPRASIKPTEPKPEVEPVSPWTGKFDVSLTGAEGNTDTQNFRTQLDVRYEDEDQLDAFTLWYRRVTTDDDPEEEKGFTQLRHEWKIDDTKWRPFVQGSYEVDKFTDYSSRAALAGGAAYQWLDGPEHKTSGRLGAGANRKFGNDDPEVEETTYEALLGLDWYWTISAVQSFTLITDLYPSISPSGEFRTITKLAYDRKVAEESVWFFRVGLDHFHDSQAAEGDKQNDYNYYLGIGRSF
jgi:hypothetical protein